MAPSIAAKMGSDIAELRRMPGCQRDMGTEPRYEHEHGRPLFREYLGLFQCKPEAVR
jgi:hypothetical protein